MNEMRKLMEAVDKLLNESFDYKGAIEARLAKGDKDAKLLRYAIQKYQIEGDSDEGFDLLIDTVERAMPELDTDQEEFYDAIYRVNID